MHPKDTGVSHISSVNFLHQSRVTFRSVQMRSQSKEAPVCFEIQEKMLHHKGKQHLSHLQKPGLFESILAALCKGSAPSWN